MKFVWLRNSIVISILPETKRGKDTISLVYLTISITSIYRLVVLGKSKEAVSCLTKRRFRLWGEITKQFSAIIYKPITIAIKRKPGII